MTVRELYEGLSELYPKSLSLAWDNDGIMVSGNIDAEVGSVLVSLDATHAALNYARSNGFNVLVSHHPMLFRGVKSVSPETLSGTRIISALNGGVTVMSFHTRCDAAHGGVNDALCRAMGFEPTEVFGDDEAPTLGRIADVGGITAGELANIARRALGCTSVRVNGDVNKRVFRAAFCGGDGKDFVYPALSAGCEVYITGDAGYNIAGNASEEGLVTIELGHFHSEFPVCKSMAEEILRISNVKVEIFNSCTYTVI